MRTDYAIVHLADSRDDYYAQRAGMATEEIGKLSWLRQNGYFFESGVLRSVEAIRGFIGELRTRQVRSLIIHIPIWADPCLAAQLAVEMDVPILLLGNRRNDTSSMVGTLGAGGALDQIGRRHIRVFMNGGDSREQVLAFIDAATAVSELRGSRLLRFGGHSLGILTAEPDALQLMKQFGVSVNQLDQYEIVQRANGIDEAFVQRHMDWIGRHADVVLGEGFPGESFEKQVRSYIALKQLTAENGAEFIAVKCQRELSDGYVCQCISHLLMNGSEDADGKKKPVVFACESDANGALTMQILHLLSKGMPAGLLDVRSLDTRTGRMIAANCGAVPEDMLRLDPQRPLSNVSIIKHAFGAGKGGACNAYLRKGEVTIARICVRDGEIWMAATTGRVVDLTENENAMIPASFPRGAIETRLDESFLQEFGSNHLHVVYGDHLDKVRMFCDIARIECRVW